MNIYWKKKKLKREMDAPSNAKKRMHPTSKNHKIKKKDTRKPNFFFNRKGRYIHSTKRKKKNQVEKQSSSTNVP